MRKFIAGLLLGLSLSAVPTAAEWGYGDMDLLKKLVESVNRIGIALNKLAIAQERIATATEAQLPAERRVK